MIMIIILFNLITSDPYKGNYIVCVTNGAD